MHNVKNSQIDRSNIPAQFWMTATARREDAPCEHNQMWPTRQMALIFSHYSKGILFENLK